MQNPATPCEVRAANAHVERLAFNLDEVRAALGGVSVTTIWRWERRGLLNAVPGVRTKLFPKTEVERFLARARSGK